MQSIPQLQKPHKNPQPVKKEMSSDEAAHRGQMQQPQIGMALIPETPVDFSSLQHTNVWAAALPTNDFQVYAVTELPEPPVLNLAGLSEKPQSSTNMLKASKDIPRLPELADHVASPVEPKHSQIDDSVPLDRDAFALYFDSPLCLSGEASADQLVVAEEVVVSDDEKMANLEHWFSDLDEICKRLAEFTPRE